MAHRLCIDLACNVTLRLSAQPRAINVVVLAGHGATERVVIHHDLALDRFSRIVGGISIGNATVLLDEAEAAAIFGFLRLVGCALEPARA
jgi:hypothetical protein